jgi:signal transduction histidine kinase
MTAEPARRFLDRVPALVGTFAQAWLLVAAATWIGLALQRDAIAVFWPAAGALAGLALATQRGERRFAAVAGALLAIWGGNLILERPLLPSTVFVAGNLGEALLLVGVLERAFGAVRFDELRPVVAFLGLCVAAAGAVGAAVAGGLVASGFAASFRDVWRTWFTSHLVGLLTVAPAVALFAGGPRGWPAVLASLRDDGPILLLLAAAAYVMMAWMPQAGGLAILLSVMLMHSLLLWIAIRCDTAIAAVALVVLGVVTVWNARHPGDLADEDIHAAAAILVAASMWTLTLGALLAEQRRALGGAAESELRLRQAMQVGRAFAFEWDPISDRVERTDPSGIVGDVRIEPSAAFFERIDPRDRPAFERTLATLSARHPAYTVRYRYRRADGRTIWLEERAQAGFDAEGRMAVLRGMTADATERVEAESALRDADRAKDRFIATLSHELRNPLAPIRNAAEALRRLAGDGEAVARCHAMIDRQLRQMVYLLDELLDVGRISQGKLRLSPRPVGLEEVLAQACAHVGDQLEAAGQRVELRRPEAQVKLHVDPARLVQAIDNLLGNASKYSPAGAAIVLEASVEAGPAGETLVVAVRDEGIGLSPADVERVFDLFTQIEVPEAGSRGGLGIGLWLVRQIVTMQGGAVSVHSEGLGRGTTFTLRIPVVTPPAAAAGADAAPPEAQPST